MSSVSWPEAGGIGCAKGGRMDCVDPEHRLTTVCIELALLELGVEALKRLLDDVPREDDALIMEKTPPDAGSLILWAERRCGHRTESAGTPSGHRRRRERVPV